MSADKLIAQIGLLIMLAAGAVFVIGSLVGLDLGSARRMGPGAFPLIVGVILVVLALITLAGNLRAPMDWQRGDPLAVLAVLSGVVAFALFTPLLGVLPAVMISVLATSLTERRFAWPIRLALAVGVAAGVWLIFIKGLGIPLPVIRGL